MTIHAVASFNMAVVPDGHGTVTERRRRQRALAIALFGCFLAVSIEALAQDVDAPAVKIVEISPSAGNPDALVPDWEQARKPSTLSGRERQAILEQVSDGGPGGVPLMNNIQTGGRTPTVRHLILTVKRPWYIHRGFLSGENVQRVDARATMRFDEANPGRAIVGLNLIAGKTYLLDFLISGEGQGDYSVETGSGTHAFPDPKGDRTHVLLALKAQKNGWTEISLRRDAGAFDLHSVEVTLAQGPAAKE